MTNPDQSSIRHTMSNGIDTFRDDYSSEEGASMTTTMIGRPPSTDQSPDVTTGGRYVAPMTTTVNAVIKVMDINRPGLSETKRNLLLFFCQGHHLALGGDALFAEALYATDHGIDVHIATEPDATDSPSGGALNTIGAVIMRYADLSPADLRTLIHASAPWQLAMKSTAGSRIEWAWLRDWFRRPDETDDPDDSRPTKSQLAAWAAVKRNR